MRSSKSRSRSKQSRSRSVGNIVNRVFDSSGPEGKVRGTPQQIIDKYNQLARDAQLSGDRVATENFYQHAEHYTRMLAEAQREQEARREAQEAQHRERQQQRAEARQEGGDQSRGDQQRDDSRSGQPQAVLDVTDGGDVLDLGSDGDSSGLVDTPESKPEGKSQRGRRPRKPAQREPRGGGDGPGAAEAAE